MLRKLGAVPLIALLLTMSVLSASAQVVITGRNSSGTAMQTAATVAAVGSSMNVAGFGSCGFVVTGSSPVGTITFQATQDGTNWVSFNVSASTAPNTLVTTTTVVGTFSGNVGPYKQVRTNLTTATSGSWTVTGSTNAMTLPIPATLATGGPVNVAAINGVTPLMGNGATGTGSQRVTVASDNTPFPVKTDQTTHGTTDLVAADITKVAGASVATGAGTASGALRVELPTDGTGKVGLNAGSALIGSVNTEGTKTTYSASVTALVPASSATDIFTITGTATKTVRITHIEISGVATAAGSYVVQLIKRSAADTSGTSSAPTVVPHDSGSAAGTATVLAYTVNPTVGAAVGTMFSRQVTVSTAASSAVTDNSNEFNFEGRGEQAVVLRGVAQVLAVNLNAVTITGGLLNIDVTWTEE